VGENKDFSDSWPFVAVSFKARPLWLPEKQGHHSWPKPKLSIQTSKHPNNLLLLFSFSIFTVLSQ
jgi:hypothetical protein